jgi:hypothetical protein
MLLKFSDLNSCTAVLKVLWWMLVTAHQCNYCLHTATTACILQVLLAYCKYCSHTASTARILQVLAKIWTHLRDHRYSGYSGYLPKYGPHLRDHRCVCVLSCFLFCRLFITFLAQFASQFKYIGINIVSRKRSIPD